jgi:exosortase A-associated hydrolase 1
MNEQALAFTLAGDELQAVLAAPADGAAGPDLGVLVVVGGPQVRTGSHRQFTLLARHLAQAGLPVLRFDVRGMGDSSGALRSFEALDEDIAAAIDAFVAARPGVRRVALWGLCDGASAALLYLHRTGDPRVAALCLLNPWVRSGQTLARTHVKHYYRQRLMEGAFWRKLFTGGVALQAARGFVANLRLARGGGAAPHPSGGPAPSYQERMAAAWAAFGGATLLLMSERDLTAKEFDEHCAADAAWQRALRSRPPRRVTLAGADHTCSTPAAHQAMLDATAAFLLPLQKGLAP